MTFIHLLITQFIAHTLADYYFQNDRLANQKNQLGFRSSFLKYHFIIVTALSFLLSFQTSFWWVALLIGSTHYIIDGTKPYINRSRILGKYAFFIDQNLHLLIILVLTWIYACSKPSMPWVPIIWPMELSMVILCGMLILKPANILIKEIFKFYEISVPGTGDLPNAGKLIGLVERILVFTFIVIGEFQAVGFLIAAKSILRFKNEDASKSEYVLIGTLLSFGIAIFLGLITMTLIRS